MTRYSVVTPRKKVYQVAFLKPIPLALVAPSLQAIFRRRRHQPSRPPIANHVFRHIDGVILPNYLTFGSGQMSRSITFTTWPCPWSGCTRLPAASTMMLKWPIARTKPGSPSSMKGCQKVASVKLCQNGAVFQSRLVKRPRYIER
jgi:hypothetical protein